MVGISSSFEVRSKFRWLDIYSIFRCDPALGKTVIEIRNISYFTNFGNFQIK